MDFFSALRPRDVGSSSLVLAVVALLLLPMAAQAQFWEQEAQIIVPNEPETVVRQFIDSLAAEFERRPTATVRRQEGGDRISFAALSDSLLDDGVGLRSASHLFVSYSFERGTVGLTEIIRSVTLIYRSNMLDDPDLALIHLTNNNPTLRSVLRNNGYRNPENLGAVTPYRQVLAFPTLSQIEGTKMVRYAGTELREDFNVRLDHLMARLTELIYDNGASFVMRMDDPSRTGEPGLSETATRTTGGD